MKAVSSIGWTFWFVCVLWFLLQLLIYHMISMKNVSVSSAFWHSFQFTLFLSLLLHISLQFSMKAVSSVFMCPLNDTPICCNTYILLSSEMKLVSCQYIIMCLLGCLIFFITYLTLYVMKHVSCHYFLELCYFLYDHCFFIDSPLWSAMKAVSFRHVDFMFSLSWHTFVIHFLSSLYKIVSFKSVTHWLELSYLHCDLVTMSLWLLGCKLH